MVITSSRLRSLHKNLVRLLAGRDFQAKLPSRVVYENGFVVISSPRQGVEISCGLQEDGYVYVSAWVRANAAERANYRPRDLAGFLGEVVVDEKYGMKDFPESRKKFINFKRRILVNDKGRAFPMPENAEIEGDILDPFLEYIGQIREGRD